MHVEQYEKNTKYFANIEKRRSEQKTVHKLVVNGEDITNRTQILEEHRSFFETGKSVTDGRTDGRTDRRSANHKSPPKKPNDWRSRRLEAAIVMYRNTENNIVHRLGKFKQTGNRPIIIKLFRRQTKVDILRKAKQIRGTGICVNEDLTKLNAEIVLTLKNAGLLRAKSTRFSKETNTPHK
ncbi:hypothetical protein DPMN_102551 [Dreissena polymorpha]|uniref:Uncharacterized protein n=1 Tax=Dreissena polymorpha TaxID=45954 RepID=A0A9D4LLB3_DREPO|nr:hypothetical protein DPMN_102551 [Dreissena polymorpha]